MTCGCRAFTDAVINIDHLAVERTDCLYPAALSLLERLVLEASWQTDAVKDAVKFLEELKGQS